MGHRTVTTTELTDRELNQLAFLANALASAPSKFQTILDHLEHQTGEWTPHVAAALDALKKEFSELFLEGHGSDADRLKAVCTKLLNTSGPAWYAGRALAGELEERAMRAAR